MKNLEQAAGKFLKERGWDKLRPSDLSKSVSIEAGELLELFQWTNQTPEEVRKDEGKLKEIQKELADVFLYAIYLSITLGFDTEKIILEKLKKAEEKYPSSLVKRVAGVDPGSEEHYWKIKRHYRRSGK